MEYYLCARNCQAQDGLQALKTRIFPQNHHTPFKWQNLEADIETCVEMFEIPRKDSIVLSRSFALLLVLVSVCTAKAEDAIRWAPDLDTARQAAAQFNVPLLIHFYGDNCIPCDLLDQRVFSQPPVIETLNKYFICVKVNATEDLGRKHAAEYQVHSWPTDVFVSADAKNLHQGVSPQDATNYLSILQSVAIRNRDRNLMLANKPAQPTENPTPMAASVPNYAGSDAPGNVYAKSQVPANVPPSMQVTARQLAAARAQQRSYTATTSVSNNNVPTAQARLTGYTRPTSSPTTPTLGASTAPTQEVQSGPLSPAQQPYAVAGAVPGSTQQTAAHAAQMQAPSYQNTNSATLQPRNTTGLVAGARQNLNSPTTAHTTAPTNGLPPRRPAQNSLKNFSSMPVVSGPDSTPNELNPKVVTAASQLGSTTPRDMENPYFDPNRATSQASVTTPPVNLYRQQAVTENVLQPPSPTLPVQPKRQLPPIPSETNAAPSAPTAPSALSATGGSPTTTIAPPTAQVVAPSLSTSKAEVPKGLEQPVADSVASNPSPAIPTFKPRSEASATNANASKPKVDMVSAQIATKVEQALALDGFCPVTLRSDSKWVEGKPEFAVKHRGKVYWMSSKEACDQFLSDPDACSPVLSGYDPYVLIEEGRLESGNIKYGLHDIVSGKYMLFSSAEAKEKYWNDFDRYSMALSALVKHASQNQK